MIMIGVVISVTPPIYKIKVFRSVGQCASRRFDSTWLFYCVEEVDVTQLDENLLEILNILSYKLLVRVN